MNKFRDMCEQLTKEIETSYKESVTMEKAERLAAQFLYAQLTISSVLRNKDLDTRMRKSGLKAVQAAVYLSETQGKDKKPTEATLQHTINTNEEVSKQQDGFDESEVDRNELERYYDIFQNAHIFYRGIAKGKFD